MLNIQQTLERFKQMTVLIVGDVMVDEYTEGTVSRISPEAPVPIVEVKNRRWSAGGAANVALNVQALGATPILCSVIGQDDNGQKLLESLDTSNISSSYLYQSTDRKTTCKRRVLSNGQQLLRIDEEDTKLLSEQELKQFLSILQDILEEQIVDVIIFQDYNKGVLFPATIRFLLLAAIRKNIPTVVDPKKEHFYEYKGVTLFKPNLREVRDQVPFKIEPTVSSLQKASTYLNDLLRNQETLITLSGDGLFYTDQERAFLVATTPRDIADVCGAGDTVVSVVALGIAANLERYEISILCNLAGGQVCEKIGVVAIDKEELIKDYNEYYNN